MSRGLTTLENVSEAPANRLSTLPAGEPPFTLGWEAARWAERMLVQPNGPRAGLDFKFTRDQLRFLLWWYAMDPLGQWLYTHGVRRLAKGSGKSPFAGVLCLIEFCGPVRLDKKDTRLPGGCRGRPVSLPLVQIAAVAESQTQNTMRMVRAFAPKRSRVVELHDLDPGKTRYYRQPEGKLEIITSSVMAAEGAEVSFVVADQTENWKPSNSGPEFASTLADNLAKSGSRMLETPNAWVPGTETVAEASWDAWLAQEEGHLIGETKILYDARMAPPGTDLADPDSLRAGLEFVYDDCDWKRDDKGVLDVRPQMERIWSPLSTPSEAKRKYLNWPTVHEEAWLDPQQLALVVERRDVTATEEIVLFFDGSKSADTTALVACCLTDGYVFVPRWAGGDTIWEPDPNDDDDVVPVENVDLAVGEVFDRFNVVAFFGDVQEWESFVKIEWPRRFRAELEANNRKSGRELVMASSSVKDPQLVAWDMRGHVFDFTRAAELTNAEIVDKGFRYDGNPVLTRHLVNCRNRPNRYGVSVGKESPASPRKIDAGVCLIGARLLRRLTMSMPTARKRAGKVW